VLLPINRGFLSRQFASHEFLTPFLFFYFELFIPDKSQTDSILILPQAMSRFSAFGRRAPVQLLPSAVRINGNSFWLAGRPSICGNGASYGLQLLCSAASVSRFSSTHSLAQNDVLLESQQLAKQGNFSKASELASAFVKEHEALPLESATYTALIDVFARAKRLDKAHSLLRDMEAKGAPIPYLFLSRKFVQINQPPLPGFFFSI
jgi:pentatricopeptide repeat protein